MHEFDGKRLIAADHADVKLEDLPKPPGEDALTEEQTKALAAWLKETLGDRVAEVKASDRLVESPALALNADKFMSPHMRRLMKAMKVEGADDTPPRVELQFNPRHAVIKHLGGRAGGEAGGGEAHGRAGARQRPHRRRPARRSADDGGPDLQAPGKRLTGAAPGAPAAAAETRLNRERRQLRKAPARYLV